MKLFLTYLSFFIFTTNAISKDIVIAIGNWPPYEYVNNNKIIGFNVSVVKDVFSSLGLNVKIKVFPWERAIKYIKEGKVDAIMSLYKTNKRENFIHFPSECLTTDQNNLITFYKNDYQFNGNLKELKDKTVIVIRENSYGEKFDKATYINKYIVNYQYQIVGMIAKNRYPFGVMSKLPFIHLAKKFNVKDKIKILEPPISQEDLYIGFTKAKNYEKLAKEFSNALKTYKKTDKYKKLVKSYL